MTDIDKIIDEAKAAVLPFESWEKLTGESALNFAAFCAFRDCGAERSIRKAVEIVEKDERKIAKRYHSWRNWSSQFRWKERAEAYDRYIEKLKQTELRKIIEAQAEMHRQVTGKMLGVVSKKLDTMNPEDLTQGNVTEWVQVAVKVEREAAGLVVPDGKAELKQGELKFIDDFKGL